MSRELLFAPAEQYVYRNLTPVRSRRAQTTNGIVTRTVYSDVRYTVLEREGTIEVADLPAGLPVLVGHMVLEYLDLCLDIRKGLIYNPDHDDEWIEDQFSFRQ